MPVICSVHFAPDFFHPSFLSRIKVNQKRLKRDDIGVVPVPKFHGERSPKKDIRA